MSSGGFTHSEQDSTPWNAVEVLSHFTVPSSRTANIVAALWPQRCKALVSVSGYLAGSQEGIRKAVVVEVIAQEELPALEDGKAPREGDRLPEEREHQQLARIVRPEA